MSRPRYDLTEYEPTEEFLQRLGVSYPRWSRKLVVRECLERGLEVTLGSRESVIYMSDGSRRFSWAGGRTTFNSRLARRVTRLKDVTSKLLRSFDLPFPDNAVFEAEEQDAAWRWAQNILPVVVKPNDGRQGQLVFVGIESKDEFDTAYAAVAQQAGGRVLVEQLLPGTEHRCLVVNNKVTAVTRRRAASVEGDGQHSIKELVEIKNTDREPIHLPLMLNDTEIVHLARTGRDPDTVPLKGERVYLRRTSNLHTGGDAIDATGTLSTEETKLIESAARRIPGLRLAGFDVLLPRDEGEKDVGFIEINDGPMISMHHFPWEGRPRNVAGAILDAMFPDTKK